MVQRVARLGLLVNPLAGLLLSTHGITFGQLRELYAQLAHNAFRNASGPIFVHNLSITIQLRRFLSRD